MSAFVFEAPNTKAEAQSWSTVHMFLSWFIACIGAYTAIIFIERLVTSQFQKLVRVRSKLGGNANPNDTQGVLLGLLAAATCISINSIWLMHFTAAYAHGRRQIRYEIGATLSSILFIFVASVVGGQIVAGGEPLLSKKNIHLLPAEIREHGSIHTSFADRYTENPDLSEIYRKLTSCNYMTRIFGGGAIVGVGVGLMHYTGMAAMRIEGAMLVYDPVIAAMCFVVAIVGGAVILFCLFNVRGTTLRIGISVVIGGAVLFVHSLGYMALSAYDVPEGTPAPDMKEAGLYDARPYLVIVAIVSSLLRFAFMGVAVGG